MSGTLTSKGQIVIPAELRRQHGLTPGTRVAFLEDELGRIVLQPVNKAYVRRMMGCLAGGGDLVSSWEKEHRREGKNRG